MFSSTVRTAALCSLWLDSLLPPSSLAPPLAWRARWVQAQLSVQKSYLKGFLCWGEKQDDKVISMYHQPNGQIYVGVLNVRGGLD